MEISLETDGAPGLSLEAFLLDASRQKLALVSLHQFHGLTLPHKAGRFRTVLELPPSWLASGTYTFDVTTSVVNSNWDHYVEDLLEFEVVVLESRRPVLGLQEQPGLSVHSRCPASIRRSFSLNTVRSDTKAALNAQPAPPRNPELDGIRGMAILLVLMWHYVAAQVQTEPGSAAAYVLKLSSLTWAGVDLFFVLSGFLIGRILLENRTAPNYFKAFYTRRACRIFPLYYVMFAAFAHRSVVASRDTRSECKMAGLAAGQSAAFMVIRHVFAESCDGG